MARIVYGVQGDALGHMTRGLALAEDMPGHEFLFLGGGKALELRAHGYRVEEVPLIRTYYAENKVRIAATVSHTMKVVADLQGTSGRLVKELERFQPEIALSDYEYFAPRLAALLGIPCVSVDNQHFLTKCHARHPKGQILSRLMLSVPLLCLYDKADYHIISVFFQLAPKDPLKTAVFPPILKKEFRKLVPAEGEHVLVYQTSPTFKKIAECLAGAPGRFLLYGCGERVSSDNLIYRAPSDRQFLEDLASCRYVISNGGLNVISEALYLGKPVLSFPIRFAYEQFFNGHMLAEHGYGAYCLDPEPDLGTILRFEEQLPVFRANIAAGRFLGNDMVISCLEDILRGGPAEAFRALEKAAVSASSANAGRDGIRSQLKEQGDIRGGIEL